MPWASSHAGTSPRRPVVATTRSAASTAPSSSRTPGDRRRAVGARLAARRRRRPGRARGRCPASARTVRRITHSKVVRRHGSMRRSSSACEHRERRLVEREWPWLLRIGAGSMPRSDERLLARRGTGRAGSCGPARGTRAGGAPAARRVRSHSNAASGSAGIGVSSRSTSVTRLPARASASAEPRPPMPAPTTTTSRPSISGRPGRCGPGRRGGRRCPRRGGAPTSPSTIVAR